MTTLHERETSLLVYADEECHHKPILVNQGKRQTFSIQKKKIKKKKKKKKKKKILADLYNALCNGYGVVALIETGICTKQA